MCLFCTAGPNAQTTPWKVMVQSLSFPPRVSLEGEILKLIYITGKQREGEKRKNTFICVKEKMKEKGCGSLSQQGKPTDPDKHRTSWGALLRDWDQSAPWNKSNLRGLRRESCALLGWHSVALCVNRTVWPGYPLVAVKISSHGQLSERLWEAAGKGPGVKTQEKKKKNSAEGGGE